jgi:hypothetical protein
MTVPAGKASRIRNEPATTGRRRFRLAGFSLLPAVLPGADIEIRDPSTGAAACGDLVAVRLGDTPICHVVAGLGSQAEPFSIVTRGLWANHDDPRTPADSIIGIVTRIGWMGIWIRTENPAFRAWLAFGRRTAPVMRWTQRTLWAHLPETARSHLRRVIGRRVH